MTFKWHPLQEEVLKSNEKYLLVLGCAGTGKTTLIPHVLAGLRRSEKALVLVPARKNAQSLQNAILGLLKTKARQVQVFDYIGYALSLMSDRHFCFVDERDRQIFLKECFQELGLSEKTFSLQAIGLKICHYKQNLLKPVEVKEKEKDRFERAAKRVYALYQRKLEEMSLNDVEDIYFMLGEVIAKKKEKYDYLIADDYQEVFFAQHKLFQMMAKNASVVRVFADRLQNCLGCYGTSSIYVEELAKKKPSIHLVESFRMPDGVMRAAQKLSRHSSWNGALEEATAKKKGNPVVLCVRDEHEEAWHVAREIKSLCERGQKYSEMAVFFRNPAQCKCFEDAFKQLSIPYQTLLPSPFYEEKEVKDVLSYLRVLHNPYDFLSLKRLINTPHRGVGSTTLKKLEEKMRRRRMTYHDLFSSEEDMEDFSAGVREKLQDVYKMLSQLNKKSRSATEMIKEVTKIINYRKNKEQTPSLSPWECFQQEALGVKNMSHFVHHLYTLHPFDYYQRHRDQVLLAHIIFSKAGEFDAVFITGMEEGIFPQRSAMLDEKEMEIERKLCYAAMSRARERIYFLFATHRTLYGGSQRTDVSRFLRDMELLDRVEQPNGKKEAAEKGGRTNGQVKKGSRVFHKMWGEGEIKSIRGEGENVTLIVDFDTVGERTLLKQVAPIEMIS